MLFKKTIAAILPLLMSAGMTADVLGCSMSAVHAEGTSSQEQSVMLDFDKTMAKGEKYAISTKNGDLKYSSDNPKAAVVSESGIIEAVGTGKAVITVVNSQNSAVRINVTVAEISSVSSFGDINADGIIDGRDATVILTYYAKTSTGYKGSLENFAKEQATESITTTASVTTTTAASTTTTVASAATTSVSAKTALTQTSTTSKNTVTEKIVRNNTADSFYFMWIDTNNNKDYIFNEQFIKVRFRIRQNCPSNDYTVKFTPDTSSIMGITVSPDKVIQGNIRVGGESIEPVDVSSENGFVIYSNNVACKQGDIIDYYISMKNNPGLAAILMKFYYDNNAMEVLSAETVGEFAEISKNGNISTNAPNNKQ